MSKDPLTSILSREGERKFNVRVPWGIFRNIFVFTKGAGGPETPGTGSIHDKNAVGG
jgi:hypothetical protein